MTVSRRLRPSGKTASQPMLRVSRRGRKKPLHGIESSSAIFILACKGAGGRLYKPARGSAEGMTTRVACGPGRTLVGGIGVSRIAKRQIRRCAVWGAGHVCRRWY